MNRPIILDQKNVTVTDMFVYLIKLVFYFDTSDLYVTPRRQRGGRTNNIGGFDMYDFFFNDNVIPILSGGAKLVNDFTLLEGGFKLPNFLRRGKTKAKAANAVKEYENKHPQPHLSTKETTETRPSNTESSSSNENTDSTNSEKAKNSIKAKKSKELKQKFGKELNKSIKSSGGWIMQKLKAFLFFILFASIYPAVPFFAVMAFVFAIFKWILWKFRKL